MRTSVILDHNGRPVPDGTPVQFFFSYPQEGLEQSITAPSPRRARRGYPQAQSRTGQLDIAVQSDPFPRTVVLQITIAVEGPAIIVPITPTPRPTPVPTMTETPVPSPAPRCPLRCRHQTFELTPSEFSSRNPRPCTRGWWPGLPGSCAGAGRGCGGRRGGLLLLSPDECAHQRCPPRGPDLPYGRVGGLRGLPALHTRSSMAAPAERCLVIGMGRASRRAHPSGSDLRDTQIQGRAQLGYGEREETERILLPANGGATNR